MSMDDGSYSYRLADIADLKSVMALERSSYSHPWSNGNFIDCFKDGYEIWRLSCIEESSALLGYGVISAAVGEAHLLNLCVASEVRGLGLGKRFMHHLMCRGVALGAKMMFLEVRESNAAAISLYSSSGFNEVGFRKGYYPSASGGESAIVMACDLLLWVD